MEGEVEDILSSVAALIGEGKLRAFGLSNETAWGTMKFLEASQRHRLPRVATIQNEYSLLCRLYDSDLAELGVREDVTLLGYSPLAAGLLTGKYANGIIAPGTRATVQPDLFGRMTEQSAAAVKEYCAIARNNGLDPAAMAIAFCMTRPFPVSPIIGATSMAQLKANLSADRIELSPDVLADIEAVRRRHPMPI
jgi:aryl-alcohol dehydrogenase-like predicted oxidoreductase